MVEAVALHNPVSFAFEVTADFMMYRKGIYSRWAGPQHPQGRRGRWAPHGRARDSLRVWLFLHPCHVCWPITSPCSPESQDPRSPSWGGEESHSRSGAPVWAQSSPSLSQRAASGDKHPWSKLWRYETGKGNQLLPDAESRAEGSSRSSLVWASSHPFLLPILQWVSAATSGCCPASPQWPRLQSGQS